MSSVTHKSGYERSNGSSSSSGSVAAMNIEKDKLCNNKNEKKARSRSISWAQLLLPSYKSRLVEFRKQFKTMPTNERLIADFACALQKEILIQGRIYLSLNYISFHANIFGWETVVVLKLCDVTAVTKANTIKVIPNAIQVATVDGNKYIFTSFVGRDRAFKRMYRLWQDTLIGTKMNASEVWQLIHLNYGSDTGVTSDDESDEQEQVDEELSAISKNNRFIVTEEVVISDEVFNALDENPRIFKRRDSLTSFRTCPESESDRNSSNCDVVDSIRSYRTNAGDISSYSWHSHSHYLTKLKYWFSAYPRESLYLRLMLVLVLVLFLMHLLILYKLSKLDDAANYVNIIHLKSVINATEFGDQL